MKPEYVFITKFAVAIALALSISLPMVSSEELSVEYYGTSAAYGYPLRLMNKMTKEEAESRDAAYLIGYFDRNRKLIRVVKMINGKRDFEHVYSYYPNGQLKRMEWINSKGSSTVSEFDESGNRKKQ